MGAVLACIGLSAKSIKESRDKKKASQSSTNHDSESQPLPSKGASSQPGAQDSQLVRDAQRGLQDEHLAAAPPVIQPVGEDRVETEGTGTKDVQRKVATAAPLPTATVSNQSNTQQIPENALTIDKKDEMASDEDYSAFLDKANQDPNEGTVNTQSKGKVELKAVDQGVKVPASLKKATSNAFYISDADEPFEPVCLKFDAKKLPDEATFAKLVNHPSPGDAEVQILDIGEWDTQGQYTEIVEATRDATKGSDVRVYRISRDGSRVEYWIVGIESGKLIGAKALAIES